ncbi:hypothetical protein GCM10025857_36420 [Alicyclobacillus contaminans]|uniref:hypothetical protein n=1 Tax=Alicyclobacillus contaminans TaxID=392016 RepID=UPI00041754E4|nr:hypothetical protein [Alicyclobacillus contaminans]GMA52285.1 hypothetical protein GCM10025857_36420 [Alicyclobacillus contaminans]
MAHPFWSYWTLLSRLVPLDRFGEAAAFDSSLETATVRAVWTSLWAGVITATAVLMHHIHAIRFEFHRLSSPHPQAAIWFGIALAVGWLASGPACYGLLRLYTLVHHVLVLNVFKCRGQRLRLLNLHTQLLPLTAPLAAAYACWPVAPRLGASLTTAVVAYSVCIQAVAYNAIFHRRRLGGLGLLLGGSVITWFVLAVGALAIAISVAVLCFFALLLLRAVRPAG